METASKVEQKELPQIPRLTYRLSEAALMCGISEYTLKRMADRKELLLVRIGQRDYVPAHELRRITGTNTA